MQMEVRPPHAATFVAKIFQGAQARGPAGGTADEVPPGHQPEDRPGHGSDHFADARLPGGRGDPIGGGRGTARGRGTGGREDNHGVSSAVWGVPA
jgi:hypothetical protein